MTTTTQKMFQDKRNSLQRLDALESLMVPLMENMATQFRTTNGKLDQLSQIVNALIGAVGTEIVTAKLVEIQLEDARLQAEDTKKHTAQLKEQGVLSVIDTVTPGSVVIATESKPDGSVHGAGWFRVGFDELNEETKVLFEGKKAGDKGTFANGNVFEILEVLKFNGAKVTPQTPVQES